MIYRQGDVLIEAATIPTDAAKTKGPIVLAHGEATGHAHTIERTDDTQTFERDGVLYLRLSQPSTVVHQEHDAIALPVGDYRVTRQREYSPEAIRNVAD